MRLNFFNTVFGAFWTAAFTGNAATVYEDGSKYLQAKVFYDKHNKAQSKVVEAKKRLILDGVSLGGTGACSIDWAHSVNWIRLGKVLPFVSAAGHVATLTVSSAEITQGLRDIYSNLFSKGQEQKPGNLSLTCLETAAHVNAVGWASLGVISLALGVIVFPGITGIFFVGYMTLSGATIFCKIYFDERK